MTRTKSNLLNRMIMDNMRQERLYQTIITDLFNAGAIDRMTAEGLLGYEIPDLPLPAYFKECSERAAKKEMAKAEAALTKLDTVSK